jgi:hypothetical protein
LPGYPSTTNNIESFHLNGIKEKDRIVTRLPTFRYLKTLEGVIRDWSLDREENLFSVEANDFVPIPNLRTFATKPVYEESFLQEAHEYNSKNKVMIKLRQDEGYLYFIPSGKEQSLTKDKCREYLAKIKSYDFDCFDRMFCYINSIRVVKLNLSCWEMSECSCRYWLKDYKCFHIASVAHRETACSFSFRSIILSLPLERKRDRGTKVTTKPALMRQSLDQRDITTNAMTIQSESDDEATDRDPKRRKVMESGIQITRICTNQPTASTSATTCSKCSSLLQKNRYTFCPNKCKQ